MGKSQDETLPKPLPGTGDQAESDAIYEPLDGTGDIGAPKPEPKEAGPEQRPQGKKAKVPDVDWGERP